MKIIEWNVHGLNRCRVPSYVNDEIKLLDADIVILTEYVASKNDASDFGNKLLLNGYFFSSSQTNQNGVLIAVKQDCFVKNFVSINSIKNSNINIHSTAIKLNNEIITIIGTRIIPEACGQLRYNQLKALLHYINSLKEPFSKKIIVTGDFNNYVIIGDETDYYNQSEYGANASCYNLQLIKKLFSENGFDVQNSTPIGNIYYNFSYIYKNNLLKYDHIFVKGLQIQTVKYNWDYKDRGYTKTYGSNPDHAILEINI